jgi:hypothetical protein
MNKIIIIPLLLFSCIGSLKQIKNDGTIPTIGVSIIITDEKQIEFADSLGKVISRRLEIVSQEKKDFEIGEKNKENDFKMEINIDHLELINDEKQIKNEKVRNKLEDHYDSLNQDYRNKKDQVVAANIVANVVANAILMPIDGRVSIFIYRDENAYYQRQNKQIAKTFSFSGVMYHIKIMDKNNKVIWKGENTQKLTLSYRMNDKEQRSVLIRNISMFIEEKVPFFKIKT